MRTTDSSTDYPLVTIIIPAYNHENYVERSLASAINQTYPNTEIIIIDDGSTDHTADIIRDVIAKIGHHKNISFLRHDNKGLSKTLNDGLRQAKGLYIEILASDDEYLPEKTSRCFEALHRTGREVAAVYCDGYIANANDQIVNRFSKKYPRPISRNTRRELILGNWIPALGLLYKKSCLDSVGGFDENLGVEDYDMLIRLSSRYRIISIRDKLFCYRWHQNNYSNSIDKMSVQLQMTAAKHPQLRDYLSFKTAVKSRSISLALRRLTALNFEFMLRGAVRRLQIMHDIQNADYSQFVFLLAKKAMNLVYGRLRASTLLIRGLNIKAGGRLYGSLSIVGYNRNITIGKNVHILGDIKIITTYSPSPHQIVIGDNVVLDRNCILFSMGGNILVGEGCFVGPNVIIQANGDVDIGRFTMLAANSSVYANNHLAAIDAEPFSRQGNTFVGVTIGENCWVGAGACILDGSTVGADSIIGGNCVVKGKHNRGAVIVGKGAMGVEVKSLLC